MSIEKTITRRQLFCQAMRGMKKLGQEAAETAMIATDASLLAIERALSDPKNKPPKNG
jgi:hypothetical protein